MESFTFKLVTTLTRYKPPIKSFFIMESQWPYCTDFIITVAFLTHSRATRRDYADVIRAPFANRFLRSRHNARGPDGSAVTALGFFSDRESSIFREGCTKPAGSMRLGRFFPAGSMSKHIYGASLFVARRRYSRRVAYPSLRVQSLLSCLCPPLARPFSFSSLSFRWIPTSVEVDARSAYEVRRYRDEESKKVQNRRGKKDGKKRWRTSLEQSGGGGEEKEREKEA